MNTYCIRETESIPVRFDAATLPSHFPCFCLNSDAIRTKIDLFETKLARLKSDTYKFGLPKFYFVRLKIYNILRLGA